MNIMSERIYRRCKERGTKKICLNRMRCTIERCLVAADARRQREGVMSARSLLQMPETKDEENMP